LIHAVAHKEFNDINIKDLIIENGVVYDVKSVLPKELVDGRL
jgi:UDP-N-acetyl-D-galactosamine dehydrogenase